METVISKFEKINVDRNEIIEILIRRFLISRDEAIEEYDSYLDIKQNSKVKINYDDMNV